MNFNPPAIEANDLTVAYDDKPVLWDVDLRIPQGVLMAIIGPNGAGKSTLIKSLIGLVPIVAGNVKIFGENYKSMRKHIAYVPQRTSVDWDFPTTVFDVVLMGTYGKLGWIKRPGKREIADAHAALEKVGMNEFSGRQISELSGGQQQRTFLARALVQNADLYLMDEPFAGVDATTEKAILQVMRELKNDGKTLAVVHHDLNTVLNYFDWACLLNIKLIQYGKSEDVLSERYLKLAYGDKFSFVKFKKDFHSQIEK